MATENDEPRSIFTRRPREKSVPMGLPLMRCPPKGHIGGIVLSHDLLGCYVHYWKGRTTPHREVGCEPCTEGNGKRWKGYLVVQDVRTNKRAILELPAIACEEVGDFFNDHRTLRGYVIKVKRVSPKSNARVTVEFMDGRAGQAVLQECPPIEPMLLRMWEVISVHDLTSNALRVVRARPGDLDDQTELPITGT